jgi:hypothetical protein
VNVTGASVVTQQTPEKTDQQPFAALQFPLGDWEAIGKPGEPSGSFSFTR